MAGSIPFAIRLRFTLCAEDIAVVVKCVDSHRIGRINPIVGMRRHEVEGYQQIQMLSDLGYPRLQAFDAAILGIHVTR